MQKIIWSACLLTTVLLGATTAGSQSSTMQKQPLMLTGSTLPAQATPLDVSGGLGVMDDLTVQVQPVDPKLDVRPLLDGISRVPDFADWQGAQVQAVRNLHDREARTLAVLWRVLGGGQGVGYLVTSPDGQVVYEFSHRSVPELPVALQAQGVPNGYLYGGPALQLAYVNGEQGAELINLLTGETLPNGELLNRVPEAFPAQTELKKTEASAQVLSLPTSAHAQDDVVYATGLYGQMKLGKLDTGVQPLQEFAKQETDPRAAMVVYDAVPDKLYIALTLSKRISFGAEPAFLAVNDPFASTPEQQLPIYINSHFPVTAVPVHNEMK